VYKSSLKKGNWGAKTESLSIYVGYRFSQNYFYLVKN